MKVKVICAVGALLVLVGVAQGGLTVIGTATYGGSDYNLVWDDDNNGNSVVWLDYTAPTAYWGNQMSWAAGLNGALTYNIDSAYSVSWSGDWRLPTAGSAPSYGMQAATQELGHLYYDELGFAGGSSGAGVTAPDLAGSVFENLALTGYWTSTEDDPLFNTEPVWMFAFKETRSAPYYDTVYGFQDIDATAGSFFGISLAVKHSGLAIRNAEVTTAVIPAPGAILLGGIGVSLVGLLRRRRAL